MSNRTASCPHCGASDLYTEERPPHVGLFCRSCNRWIKWIPRDHDSQDSPKPTSRSNPEQPKPAGCGHCNELERLLKTLGGIEHELTIIVRALVGSR